MSLNNDQMDAIVKARAPGGPRPSAARRSPPPSCPRAGHPAWAGGATATAAKPKLDLDPGPRGEVKPATATTTALAPSAAAILQPRKPEQRALPARLPTEGLEVLDASDFQLPTLALSQAQSQIEGDVEVPHGHWYYRQQPQINSAERKLVILDVKKGRSFMLPFDQKQRPDAVARVKKVTGQDVSTEHEGPMCHSRDRVTPIAGEGLQPFATSCADCPFAKWQKVGGASVMDCGESYDFLILDVTAGVDAGMPAWTFLRGAAIKPTKSLNTNLITSCAQKKVDNKPAPVYAFEITLGSKKVKGDNGTYYVPVWGFPVPITDVSRITSYAGVRAGCLAAQEQAVPE